MKEDELTINIRSILLKYDPMGIYFADDKNTDEYDMEVDEILKSLPKILNEKELLETVHNIFKKKFGDFEAGYSKKYEKISQETWELIKKDKKN